MKRSLWGIGYILSEKRCIDYQPRHHQEPREDVSQYFYIFLTGMSRDVMLESLSGS